MDSMDITRQKHAEMDRQIRAYVRGFQDLAPVTVQSIHAYLTGTCRIKVLESETADRVRYLVSAGDLKRIREWDGGELVRYEITAQGMDRMDGAIPPRNWKGAEEP